MVHVSMPLSSIVLSRSCRAANTIYRLAEYCLEDPVGVVATECLECAFVNIQIVCYDDYSLRTNHKNRDARVSIKPVCRVVICVCVWGGVLISGANISLLTSYPYAFVLSRKYNNQDFGIC